MTTTAWLATVGAIVLWALFATLVGLVGPMPPLLLTGTALCIGSLATIHHVREWRVPMRVFLFGATCLFVYHACLVSAFALAPIAEANLVNYLWPLFLVLLSPALTHGSLRRGQVLGCAVAFVGCAIAIAPPTFTTGFGGASLAGYLLAVIAAATWAVYSLGSGRSAPHSSWAVGGFCLSAGVFSLFAHALFEPPYRASMSDWIWVAVIGVGPLGLAFVLWHIAMRRGDAARIGTLAYATPILSTLALVAAGETPADALWKLGPAVALVVVGVLFAR